MGRSIAETVGIFILISYGIVFILGVLVGILV